MSWFSLCAFCALLGSSPATVAHSFFLQSRNANSQECTDYELRPQFGGEAQRAKISFPREMAFAQKSSLATDVDGYRVRPAGKRKSSNSTTEA